MNVMNEDTVPMDDSNYVVPADICDCPMRDDEFGFTVLEPAYRENGADLDLSRKVLMVSWSDEQYGDADSVDGAKLHCNQCGREWELHFARPGEPVVTPPVVAKRRVADIYVNFPEEAERARCIHCGEGLHYVIPATCIVKRVKGILTASAPIFMDGDVAEIRCGCKGVEWDASIIEDME